MIRRRNLKYSLLLPRKRRAAQLRPPPDPPPAPPVGRGRSQGSGDPLWVDIFFVVGGAALVALFVYGLFMQLGILK